MMDGLETSGEVKGLSYHKYHIGPDFTLGEAWKRLFTSSV